MAAKRVLVFFLILLLLGVLSYFYPQIQEITGQAVKQAEYEKEKAVLLRVIDGDTIETDLGNVRLLGINTPEKGMPYSNESKDFLRQLENKTLELLRDSEDTDKYSRKLRYLFYGSRMLNLEILEKGFASAYMTEGLRYEEQILRAEKYAADSGIGIWKKSPETCAVQNCILLKELNATSEFFIIENQCSFDCNLAGWFVKDAGRNTFRLLPLGSGETKMYTSAKSVWNNDADSFFMFDENGLLVIYYSY